LARREDVGLAKVLDRFVGVRVVQTWGLDLARFQFDWELTWAAVFLNADGTVYGRYGTRRGHDDADKDISFEGFRQAAEGALDLHGAYPGNARELAGKRSPKPRWPTPEVMPALKGRPNVVPANGSRAGCVHCHQVHEGELWSLRSAGVDIPDRLLWSFPTPDGVGLSLDPSEGAVARKVEADAKECGFEAGDRIVRLGGQPILSIADVQWVLHQAEDSDSLETEVERGGRRITLKLALKSGWRRRGDYTWRSIGWSLRHRLAGTGPLESAPLPREGTGMKETAMALRLKRLPPDWVKDRNLSAAAELREGDIIVGVDGRRDLAREADFFAYLLQKKAPGSVVALTILRAGKTVQAAIKLP
jgi:serine protease Do